MTTRILIGAILAACLGCPSLAEDDLRPAPKFKDRSKTIPSGLKIAITDKLRSGFLDPEAAIFYELVASGELEDFMICGRVNVKNLYGAYTGSTIFHGFVVQDPLEVVIIDFSRTPDDSARVHKTCETFGMQLERPYYWLQN